MTFHEIWSILIPSVIGFAGVLSGIWIGYHISNENERQREKKEIKKIQRLLTLDFSQIYRLNKKQHENNIKIIEQIQLTSNVNKYISDIESLIKFITKFSPKTIFTNWNALETSGSLIKLDERDIVLIQLAHDKLLEIRDQELIIWADLKDKISKLLVIKDTRTQELFIKYILNYWNNEIPIQETRNNQFEYLKKINWIDLNASFNENNDGKTMVVDGKGSYHYE